MSSRDDDLVLYLKLDDIDISTDTVPDSSHSHRNAKVYGASLVADDAFGACLSFDEQNDYLEVSGLSLGDANSAHTIEGWVKMETYPQARSWILLLGQEGYSSHYWLLNTETAEENLGKKAQLGAWGAMVDQATLIKLRQAYRNIQSDLNALSSEYQAILAQIPHSGTDTERLTAMASGMEATQNGMKTELGLMQAAPQMVEVEMPLAEWVHIATVYDGKSLICYLNGHPIESPKAATINLTEKRLTLGKRGIANDQNFQGKIAHLRIYRRALSESEIREDMDSDKVALPAFRRGHPIGFSLCDLDENYVLFIGGDPKEEYKLNLELRNTSAQAIRFEEQGDQASIAKHHFELVFRNGVLSDETLKKLRENKDEIMLKTEPWDLYSPGEDSRNGAVSVYFLYKDPSKIFGPGARLVIPLRKISANPGSGARGTRIELKLNKLTYVDETTPITGSRIQHLQIISHLGSRRVPLHASFAGSNRILNDGHSENTLVLQLMNVLRSEQDSSVDVTLTTKSKFLLSFDVESTKEVAPWSLCTGEEIKAFYNTPGSIIVAKIDPNGNVFFDPKGRPENDTGRWKVTPTEKGQGESPVWSISPTQDIVLKRDGYLQIYLSNLKTSLPSGLTNLYLEYKGIDGFWDGQIVCPIEKAPLLFYDLIDQQGHHTRELRVGIGCVKPEAKLEIALTAYDADTKPLVIRNRKDKVNYLTVLQDGKVGIGQEEPKALLDVNGEIRANFFRAGEGYSKRLPVGTLPVGTGTSFDTLVFDDSKWYRIAKIVAPKPLTSAGAEFSLRATIAGRTAQVLTFRIVGFSGLPSLAKHPIGRLTILSNTLSLVFTKARLVMPMKVADACAGYLEICTRQSADGETDVSFSIYDNLNIPAWQPIVWEEQPDPVPSTFAACEYSLDRLFLVADRTAKLSLDNNGDFLIHGKVGIGTNHPGATLAINGGLHVGGDADPGDKNLLVDGKATIEGGLHVGAPLPAGGIHLADPRHSLTVGGSLLIEGDSYFLGGSLFVRNSIEVKPAGGEAPTLAVAGHISEKLDVIPIKGDGKWGSAAHPIKQYFSRRLHGKPVGTMLRAITDYDPSYTKAIQDWRGHWWTGWVDANGQIRVIHNHRNTDEIAPQDSAQGGGTVVYADR